MGSPLIRVFLILLLLFGCYLLLFTCRLPEAGLEEALGMMKGGSPMYYALLVYHAREAAAHYAKCISGVGNLNGLRESGIRTSAAAQELIERQPSLSSLYHLERGRDLINACVFAWIEDVQTRFHLPKKDSYLWQRYYHE